MSKAKQICLLLGLMVAVATPAQSQSDFQKSYDQSGCRIISLAVEHTALGYLSGHQKPADVLSSTSDMLKKGNVDLPLQRIALNVSGDILKQILPLRQQIKTFQQAQSKARELGDFMLKRCLTHVSTYP